MRILLLTLLATAPFVPAQSARPPAGDSDPAQSKIRLTGSVVSHAGESVPRATLRLQSSGTESGQAPTAYVETTDNAGKFVFEDVAPGRYSLSAERTGFLTQRYGERSNLTPGMELMLAVGKEMADLVIKLVPQAVITGRVADQDGDPLPGMQITVLRFHYVRGRRQLTPAAAGSTDDQGNFRISNLAPGRYYLSATDRRTSTPVTAVGRPGQQGTPEVNVTTYYPNALDPTSAAALDLAAGGEVRADIRMRKARVYSIRGRAVDSAAIPAINSVLSITPKDDSALNLTNRRNTQTLSPSGAFEFRNLVSGTYVVQAMPGSGLRSGNGEVLRSLGGRLEVTITGSNIDNALLTLGAGAEVIGSVRLEGGDVVALLKASSRNSPGGVPAASGTGALAGTWDGRPAIGLIESEGVGMATPSGQINEQGKFRLQAVAHSKYFIDLEGLPDTVYIKSIGAGGQDVTHAPLDLTAGAGAALDIVLVPNAPEVTGVVRNSQGESISRVTVTLWPKTPDAGSLTEGVRTGYADQHGSFRFGGLAPGDYYLAAWEEVEPGLVQNSGFRAHFNRDAQAITLREGAHEMVDATVIPREAIALEAAKIQ